MTFGFLEHVPDRQRAEALAGPAAAQLPEAEWYLADADAEGYGLTPLAFAPTPDSRWRQLFDDAQIEAHLDRLERDQQTDGGWPVTWEPPSEASRLEWRGIVTSAPCALSLPTVASDEPLPARGYVVAVVYEVVVGPT